MFGYAFYFSDDLLLSAPHTPLGEGLYQDIEIGMVAKLQGHFSAWFPKFLSVCDGRLASA